MFAPRGDEGQPTVDRCGQGGGGSTTCGCPHWKKKRFTFFLLWLLFRKTLSFINLIFEDSVLDKIKLDCNTTVLSAYHRSKNYFFCHSMFILSWCLETNLLRYLIFITSNVSLIQKLSLSLFSDFSKIA